MANPVIDAALAKAVTVPSATIHAHVEQVRRRNPEASPARIIHLLEREYLAVVVGAGAAVGATAAMPAIGTGVSLALTAADVGTFFASSAAFSLAVASVHGIEVEDADRRRSLLLATVLGESGVELAGETALAARVPEVPGMHLARALLTRMPTTTIRQVNAVLTRKFVRSQVTRQGGLAVGRLAPFGIGAVIGVAGARVLGRNVVKGARAAFGEPPAHFVTPRLIEVDARPDKSPQQVEPRRRLLGRRKD